MLPESYSTLYLQLKLTTMKKTLAVAAVIILSFSISSSSFAQEKEVNKNKEKKEIRKEKKAYRKAVVKQSETIRLAEAKLALEDFDFVLEATMIYTKRGDRVKVSDNVNFISVEDNKAVIQVAYRNNHSESDVNGLGGVTLSGQISEKKLSTDKRGNQYITFNVTGSKIQANVRITLGTSDNYARAEVNTTTTNDKISFKGKLIPRYKTTIYTSSMEN